MRDNPLEVEQIPDGVVELRFIDKDGKKLPPRRGRWSDRGWVDAKTLRPIRQDVVAWRYARRANGKEKAPGAGLADR